MKYLQKVSDKKKLFIDLEFRINVIKFIFVIILFFVEVN